MRRVWYLCIFIAYQSLNTFNYSFYLTIMPAAADKRKENLKKNVKLWKSKVRICLTGKNAFRCLLTVALATFVLWLIHAVYFLHSSVNGPELAVLTNLEFKGLDVYLPQSSILRGEADQEWLKLPARSDPIEFVSTWELKTVTKPLTVPNKPMKRLDDSPSNYPGYAPRMMHGHIGRHPSGTAHPWESSLKVPLDREFPDQRRKECAAAPFYTKEVVDTMPAASVVFIFSNEPWETLIRSIHSVLNNTPPHLLYEIILVDDGSTDPEYTTDGNLRLVDYIKCCLPPKVKYTRTNSRAGITRARVSGINLAKADIFVILDSHIEAEPGWLEPLTYKIMQDPTAFVMPMIDSIKKDDTFTPAGGGVGCSLGIIWKVMEHALDPKKGVSPDHRILDQPWGYISSPSMSGGLFAGNKQVFLDLGGYDLAMSGWGAENVEFGIRLWQCGANLQCSQCSRVAHIFSRGQFYKQSGGEAVVNRLRTAGVWMDEFAVLPWTFNGKPDWSKAGDMSDMMKLRKNLQCHDFKWFLTNVWPESSVHNIPEDMPYYGSLVHKKSGSCIKNTNRNSQFKTEGGTGCGDVIFYSRSQSIGSGHDDESYLQELKFDWPRPTESRQLYSVKVVSPGKTSDDVQLIAVKSGKCLQVEAGGDKPGNVEFAKCSDTEPNQVWTWDKFSLEGMTYFSPENF
eukprot:GHVH01000542.1.p1 GENE.GHVH01000542.1~~GHVH01000542.1.p1  ORF type:complete len:681 (+),score=74.78 GHVH01000542.1:1015-3057(+)